MKTRAIRERPKWSKALVFFLVLGALYLLRPSSGSLQATSSALLVVAVLVFGIWWWNRRQRSSSIAASARLKSIESLRLSQGQVLYLVEADGCRLLLTGAQTGCRLITRLDRDRDIDLQKQTSDEVLS